MNIIDSLLNINFTSGREGHNNQNIVLHTMSGTVSGRDSYFRSPDAKASVHYGIGLNGDITRWVSEMDTAWQTDNAPLNAQSIGIMHEDNANPNDKVRADAMYNASAELVADLCMRYGISCKLVEVDGNHMPLESGIVFHHQVSLSPTECPAALDSNRILTQAQAILDPPAPEPPKPVAYEPLPSPKKMRVKDMANGGAELWDMTFRAWEDVKSVLHLHAGDEFDAVAVAHHPLGGEYYMTAEDYNNSGQSDVPFRPWGANVDDLEDYPVEDAIVAPELQPAEESSPAQTPEPTPPAPQITYSELPTPLNFVTNKVPTSVYDLDMDTFAKITAVRELAEGTPFEAISKAEVVDGNETTYYYVDNQNQSIDSADLTPAPSEPAEQEQTTAVDPPASKNEEPANTQPEPLDLNKKFNYRDFPDGPKQYHGVGTTYIDDLNSVNPKPQETLQDKQPILIQGAFADNGVNYYRSVKSVENGDWYAIPINAVTHDNETDHLSSSVIDMSKKQKMLDRAGNIAGTPLGLIRDIYFKTKKG